jgi:hypothetical protein
MRHPDLLMFADAPQDLRPGISDIENSQAELAFIAFPDRSAQQVCDQLLAVTDAKYGLAGRQNRFFDPRTRVVVNAARPSRDDNAPAVPQIFNGGFARKDLGGNTEVPNLAGN